MNNITQYSVQFFSKKFICFLANRFHPRIKFMAEISDKEATFVDTIVYKGTRFYNQSKKK